MATPEISDDTDRLHRAASDLDHANENVAITQDRVGKLREALQEHAATAKAAEDRAEELLVKASRLRALLVIGDEGGDEKQAKRAAEEAEAAAGVARAARGTAAALAELLPAAEAESQKAIEAQSLVRHALIDVRSERLLQDYAEHAAALVAAHRRLAAMERLRSRVRHPSWRLLRAVELEIPSPLDGSDAAKSWGGMMFRSSRDTESPEFAAALEQEKAALARIGLKLS